MAAPIVPLLALAALGLAAASGRRRTTTGTGTYYGRGRVCTLTSDQVSLEDSGEQDRWVRCAGRTADQVSALAARLSAAGRTSRASRVRALWERRRRVEDSPPSSSTVAPSTRAEIERTVSTPDSAVSSLPVEPAPESVAPSSDASAAPPPPVSHGATTTSSSTSSPTTSSRASRRSRSSTRSSTPVDYSNPARAIPAHFSAATATRGAPELRDCLRQRDAGQCRRRLRQFQTAAGIPVDGRYGPISYYALVFWLGNPSGAADLPPAPEGLAGAPTTSVYRAPGNTPPPAPAPSMESITARSPSSSSSSSPSVDDIAQMGRDMTRTHEGDAPPLHREPDEPAQRLEARTRELAQAALVQLSGADDRVRATRIEQVATFQRQYGHGLTADGLYGPATRTALSTVLGIAESSLPRVTVHSRGSHSSSHSSSRHTS